MMIGVPQVMGMNADTDIRLFRLADRIRGKCLQSSQGEHLRDQRAERRRSQADEQLAPRRSGCLKHGGRDGLIQRPLQVLARKNLTLPALDRS